MKSRLLYLRNKIRRNRYAPLAGFAGRIILFIAGGMTIGMITAWHMIDKGSPLTTVQNGPWRLWFNDGKTDSDPYTLAHMARSGRLPIISSNALYFTARQDSEGEPIGADCDYLVIGKPLAADWWSLALYNKDGSLRKTATGRSSINSSSVLRLDNGGYEIHLSPRARPGNWIEISGEDNIVLMLRLYGIHVTKDAARNTSIEQNLPEIRRLDCR